MDCLRCLKFGTMIFRLSTASRKKKLENCKLNEHTDGVMVGGAALLAKEDDGLA